MCQFAFILLWLHVKYFMNHEIDTFNNETSVDLSQPIGLQLVSTSQSGVI